MASAVFDVVPGPDRRGCWLGLANDGSSSMGLAGPDQIGTGEWVEEEILRRERDREGEKEREIYYFSGFQNPNIYSL